MLETSGKRASRIAETAYSESSACSSLLVEFLQIKTDCCYPGIDTFYYLQSSRLYMLISNKIITVYLSFVLAAAAAPPPARGAHKIQFSSKLENHPITWENHPRGQYVCKGVLMFPSDVDPIIFGENVHLLSKVTPAGCKDCTVFNYERGLVEGRWKAQGELPVSKQQFTMTFRTTRTDVWREGKHHSVDHVIWESLDC